MSNSFFKFKQFIINQDKCAFKVGTDGVILGAYANLDGAKTILDIGTGTGLIALMAAQRSDALIYAIEPDELSFEQARENFAASVWTDRITVNKTRIQDYFPRNMYFDKIISNPPFFVDSLKNPDNRLAVARHNDSLPFGEFIEGIGRLLTPEGSFETILPVKESAKLVELATKSGLFPCRVLHIKANPTSKVIRKIINFKNTLENCIEEELIIDNGQRYCYTERYKELTKDFYL